MKVYAKRDLIVEGFNARNKKGNKLRKGRGIKKGEAFEVKRKFTATGGATHGLSCLELIGPNEELYQVTANDFMEEKQEEIKKEPGIKERTEFERLLCCIRGIIKDPENEEFTFGFKQGGYSEEQDEQQIRLEKLVGNKKVFVQGRIESRYISPQSSGDVTVHRVIYFRDFAGNLHKKWIYPSKNKSDGILMRKIRSIMREWVTELVKKEEEAQREDQEIREEQEQLRKDLEEFSPINAERGSGVLVSYGDPKRDFKIRVEFSETGNYRIKFGYGSDYPAFAKEDLKSLLRTLSKAV